MRIVLQDFKLNISGSLLGNEIRKAFPYGLRNVTNVVQPPLQRLLFLALNRSVQIHRLDILHVLAQTAVRVIVCGLVNKLGNTG